MAFTSAGHGKGVLVKGCRCCFPPDTMFEDACEGIAALGFCTFGNAQKFVRLCGAGSGTMRLSKGKVKNAMKLGRDGPLTAEQVEAMQRCVDEAYASVLGLGDIGDGGGDAQQQAEEVPQQQQQTDELGQQQQQQQQQQ